MLPVGAFAQQRSILTAIAELLPKEGASVTFLPPPAVILSASEEMHE